MTTLWPSQEPARDKRENMTDRYCAIWRDLRERRQCGPRTFFGVDHDGFPGEAQAVGLLLEVFQVGVLDRVPRSCGRESGSFGRRSLRTPPDGGRAPQMRPQHRCNRELTAFT